jgi:hypothetical protein
MVASAAIVAALGSLSATSNTLLSLDSCQIEMDALRAYSVRSIDPSVREHGPAYPIDKSRVRDSHSDFGDFGADNLEHLSNIAPTLLARASRSPRFSGNRNMSMLRIASRSMKMPASNVGSQPAMLKSLRFGRHLSRCTTNNISLLSSGPRLTSNSQAAQFDRSANRGNAVDMSGSARRRVD